MAPNRSIMLFGTFTNRSQHVDEQGHDGLLFMGIGHKYITNSGSLLFGEQY